MISALWNFVSSYLGVNFTTLLCGITVYILLRRFLFTRRYNPPLPPSPMVSLPVIGHLYLMDNDLRKVLRKYRQHLGNIYSLQIGTRKAIVIAGYNTLKDAFIKQGDAFSARPSMYVTDKVTRKTGVVLSSGPIWKEHRRFCLSTLKYFGMGKSSLETKIHDEVSTLLTSIQNRCGQRFDPKTLITTSVANIISSIVFKRQFKHGDDRIQKLIAIFEENLTNAAGVGNFLPWLDWFPGDLVKVKKLMKNSDHIFEYTYGIIADHEKDFDENAAIDDFTSAYISELRKLKNSGEQTTMCYEQFAGVIGDLFIAGSHSTATAIRWAIPCLVEHPHIQEKLFEEVSSVIGTDRLPSTQDKTKLVYLEAFYLEVLRYCNLTIASGAHATTHDLVFKGFTIPRDAVILPDLDSVLTDVGVWGDPDVFRPERFIDDDGTIKKYEENIVFFLGKRSCIGESLARMELLIFLGALIQNFKFESCPGETLTVESVDGVFGFVHGPKPYEVMIIPR